MKACLEELGKDTKRFSPRGIHSQISRMKNELVSPEEYTARVASFWDQTVAETYELYQRRLHASNAVDFDDLLMLTVQVFERFPEALERWRKTFRYVLVDEYQDTNHAQYRLLQLLGGEHGNVCAVGDQDQSIYSFRSADIRNIIEFEKDFPGTQVVTLEQNYRSTNTILRAANDLIDQNTERKPKRLFSDLGEGEPVRVIEVEDEHAEARFVAAEIASLDRRRLLGERDRGLLSDERAVASTRGRARAAGRAVPGHRRAALLRARRDSRRDRVSERAREPAGRDVAAPHREPASPRHRRHLDPAARHACRGDRPHALPGDGRSRGRRGHRRVLPCHSLVPLDDGVAHGALAGAARGRAPRARAREDGHARRARGGAHDRGARPDREPPGARRRRARAPPAGRGAVARGVPPGHLARLRSGHDPRRARTRNAHDAAQREGPRVPRRLHDRDGGGHLPARALDRGAGDRGGAPPLLRRE